MGALAKRLPCLWGGMACIARRVAAAILAVAAIAVVVVCVFNNDAASATSTLTSIAPETEEMEALPASRAEAVKDYTAEKAHQKVFDDSLLGAWSTVFTMDKEARKKGKKVMVPPAKMHKSHGGHLREFHSWMNKAGLKTPKGHPSQTKSSMSEAAAARHFQVKTATAISNAKMAASEKKKKWSEYVGDQKARMRDITKESRKKAHKELRVKKDIKKAKAQALAKKKKAMEKAVKKKKNPPSKKKTQERELKLCLKDAGKDKVARKECQGVALAASLLGAIEDVHEKPRSWGTARVIRV